MEHQETEPSPPQMLPSPPRWGPPQTPAESYASTPQAPEAQRGLWSRLLVEALETALLAALIFLAVRFSLQNFRVEGISMAPSLEDGEYLIINRLAYLKLDLRIFDWLPFFHAREGDVVYLFGAPKRGDVVVFRSPVPPHRYFIKRIIGIPGDTVQIDGVSGRVYVNGRPLEEPYVQGKTRCSFSGNGCGPWVIPPGHYFVLGDNRENSTDSRYFGLVAESHIVGKAFITYWPPRDFGLAPNHSISFAEQ
jgi:signal peptidase I